jgi:hypothetical protein
MPQVLHWNGEDVPDELRRLPAGRYVVQRVDDVPALSPEEEEGLREALASLRAGRGRTPNELRRTLDAALRR